jgi:hypothetical protein
MDEDLTSSTSSTTFGNNSNPNYNRNSNSNYDPNMFSARGGPRRGPMTEEEGAALPDEAYEQSWIDAGVSQIPINIGTNRRVRQLFNYCSNTLNYLNNFGWGLMNYDKTSTYNELSKHGATINRRELTGAHTALMGSQAFHASTEGVKGDRLREYTRQVQYGCCKAVVDKVVTITFEDNPNQDNPNDNGAGLGNLMFDMLTDTAGEAKESRSEIMAELIFIQVANIILYNISAQYEGGVSWLEKQIRTMYGEAALQEYKRIVTTDDTLAYINRTWLYALLIFLDNNPRNNRAREITNCPMSWFGFAALGATVFKYREVEPDILPHQIESAIKGRTGIVGVGSITNLTQLKKFLRDAIAGSSSVRYDKVQIVNLLTDAGFPDDNRDITLNSLDESIEMMSGEIVRNAGNLSALGAKMDESAYVSNRAYDQFSEQSKGVAYASLSDKKVHPSALYPGEMFDPMATRDDSQRSIDNWDNSQDTDFEPRDNPNFKQFTVPTREYLERSGQIQKEAPSQGVSARGVSARGVSTADPYRFNYNNPREIPRSTNTSAMGLTGLRPDNSNSFNSNSNSSNSNSSNMEEEYNYEIGGKRRRRTRKTKKSKKTRKMTKPKKMRKSRKKR